VCGHRIAPGDLVAATPAISKELEAISSILLRDWEFEMSQPSDSYRNDHSKMVVQLQQPCAVRYRRRRKA
jgi:sterol 14-demethylase